MSAGSPSGVPPGDRDERRARAGSRRRGAGPPGHSPSRAPETRDRGSRPSAAGWPPSPVDDGRAPLHRGSIQRVWRAPARSGRRRPCRSVDRPDRQLEHAVRAADERHDADPGPQPAVDRDDRRAPRRPPGPAWPRKTASIAKRMNIMWMPFVPVSHRPVSGSSSGTAHQAHELRPRASRPTSSRVASSVVRRVEVAGAQRRGHPSVSVPATGLDLQVLDDQDDRRPEDDDEQRREDAADEREQHLDRRLGGHLLGALAALDAELLATGPGAPW